MQRKYWEHLSKTWDHSDQERLQRENTASIFFETIMRDDVDELLLLIRRGCSPNLILGQRTSLMIAAEYGSQECLSILLRLGANLGTQDENGYDALFWSIKSQSNACIDLILSQPQYRYKRLPTDNSTALIFAAKTSYVHGVRSIVNHDPKQVFLVDRRGQSALWHVLSKAELSDADNEIARILMDQGADPDLADLAGITPREAAITSDAQSALERQELKTALDATPEPTTSTPSSPGPRPRRL